MMRVRYRGSVMIYHGKSKLLFTYSAQIKGTGSQAAGISSYGSDVVVQRLPTGS